MRDQWIIAGAGLVNFGVALIGGTQFTLLQAAAIGVFLIIAGIVCIEGFAKRSAALRQKD